MKSNHHTFNTEVAEKYGIQESILIHNFQFWIQKNIANEKNLRDGRTWTYNSRKALHKLFPYMTESRIKGAISRLVEVGVLVKGNYNKSNYDKTCWYAFNNESEWVDNSNYSIGQKKPIEEKENSNRGDSVNQPIPDINTHIKTVKEKYIKENSDFDIFWDAYPKKTGKQAALKLWEKKKPPINDVLNALSWQTKTKQWDDGFVPNPTTYLNRGNWEDEQNHNEPQPKLTKQELNAIAFKSICGDQNDERTIEGTAEFVPYE